MSTAVDYFKTRATNEDGGNYELPPTGIHPAVLVGLIDLGTHESTFKGQVKDRHKILLIWELTNEADSRGENYLVCQDYTWSLHVKAELRKVVDGYLGKALPDGDEFDLLLLLGKPCMISLSEGISGGGKRFVEVASVSPPMRGVAFNAPTKQPYAFHLQAISTAKDELEIPDWVPRLYGRNVVDDIRQSKEFRSLPPF